MIPWSKRHATTFAINVCTQLRRRRFLNCNWRSQWNDTKLFDTSAICVEVTDTSSTEKLSPSRSMFAQEFLVHLQEKLETSQVKPSQAYSTRSSSIWGRYNSSWLPACNDISLEVNEDLSGVEHQVKVTQALDHYSSYILRMPQNLTKWHSIFFMLSTYLVTQKNFVKFLWPSQKTSTSKNKNIETRI